MVDSPHRHFLERGIAEGVFRPLNPFLTSINMIAVCVFYFNAYENLKYLEPDRPFLTPQAIEQQNQETVNLILAGVRLHKLQG